MTACSRSPCTMAHSGQSSPGQWSPSIQATSGRRPSAATARRIASSDACRMLRRSISSTLACATALASARSTTMRANASRCSALSSFESLRPLIARAGTRITAAANTGPASGPRPASSTPQMLSAAAIDDAQDRGGGLLRRVLPEYAVDLAEPLDLPALRGSVVQQREQRLRERAGRGLVLQELRDKVLAGQDV